MEDWGAPRRLDIFRVGRLTVVGILMFALGFGLRSLIRSSETHFQLLSPLGSTQVEQKKENPYAPYSFSALRSLQLTAGPLSIDSLLDSQPSYNSYMVSWSVPDLSSQKMLRVSGQMNIPTGNGPFPIILMMRGYVEKDQYQTGIGTKNAAAAFAKNGYITIAPDFLGYGQSDPESNDILIARFARPIVVQQLLADLGNLTVQANPSARPEAESAPTFGPDLTQAIFNTSRIGMWAHSNGGQIALSLLEITSRNIPTTLWAPVSQKFPYSVLYFTNDLDDGGKYIRGQLANFEFTLKNNVNDFSILNEPSRIQAPIQIHQGGSDESVPLAWSVTLKKELTDATVSAQLFTYPKSNHQMVPDWDTAVQRDLQFFAKYLK